MGLQTISDAANPEVPLNNNFGALGWAGVFARDPRTTENLTWGFYGGPWNNMTVNDGTVTMTDAQTNRIVVHRNTGAVSTSTADTNWNNPALYGRLYRVVTAGGIVTSYEDHRTTEGGAHHLLPKNNFSVAAQTPAAATRTYITGSAIAIPPGKLRIGTIFRWRFDITKTAAGNAASTIDVAVGTNGTTGDTARVSFTKPAGTAAVDHGTVEITAVCRGPLSASGIFSGVMTMVHNLENTGHMVIPCMSQVVISGTFDVTTANLIVGLCITSGASDAITIEQVVAEALNLG